MALHISFTIIVETDLLGESEIQDLALKMVLWYFLDATNVPFLAEVPLSILRLVLDHRHLHVHSEFQVFETLNRWVEIDLSERAQFSPSLVQCLRMKDLSVQDINDMLNYESVRQSKEATVYIKKLLNQRSETMAYSPQLHMGVNDICDVIPKEQVCRQPPTFPCVVGRLKPEGTAKYKEKDLIPYLFIYRNRKLEPYLSLKQKLVSSYGGNSVKAEGYQIIGAGPLLYVIGGEFILGRSNWNKSIWKYDIITSRWEHITSMEIPRYIEINIYKKIIDGLKGFTGTNCN